jgi:hypothetical protein
MLHMKHICQCESVCDDHSCLEVLPILVGAVVLHLGTDP